MTTLSEFQLSFIWEKSDVLLKMKARAPIFHALNIFFSRENSLRTSLHFGGANTTENPLSSSCFWSLPPRPTTAAAAAAAAAGRRRRK